MESKKRGDLYMIEHEISFLRDGELDIGLYSNRIIEALKVIYYDKKIDNDYHPEFA